MSKIKNWYIAKNPVYYFFTGALVMRYMHLYRETGISTFLVFIIVISFWCLVESYLFFMSEPSKLRAKDKEGTPNG